MDFSPNADLFASCGKDRTIRIWRRGSPQPVHVLRGHADEVWKVEFLDSTILASVSWDRTARLWDVIEGEEIGIFAGPGSPDQYMPYSPDGVSRLYRIHLERLVQLAKFRRPRDFNEWERRRFLHS